MYKRLIFLLKLTIFWLLLFVFSRVYFLIFNYTHTFDIGFIETLLTIVHGSIMDLSAVGYVLILPCLLVTFSIIINRIKLNKIINIYNYVFIIISAGIVIVDANLYRYWGFRLDATPLLYLKTPSEAFASISVLEIIINSFLAILMAWAFIWTFIKFIKPNTENWTKCKLYNVPILLFITTSLLIPIRGGFGIAPMNVGKVYFSNKNYANHAAINVVWNFGFSVSEMNESFEQYHYYSESEAKTFSQFLRNNSEKADSLIINNSKPNIILILTESLTANLVEAVGGLPKITPCINKLSEEGVLFTNFYASGDRSDKGIVAVMSGFPAQPNTSIIKYANKTQSLPRISVSLKKNGYNTGFYYGGDIDFANMRSYLMDCNFDNIVWMNQFPKSTWNSKWGAHDHVVFQRLFADVCKQKQPFFDMIFTLSSHEPFEVPSHFDTGNDNDSKFKNSIHYTDSCIGDFVDKCKKQGWWKNTLIIIVADHGHGRPFNLENSDVRKFHIPMLWLGGALKQPAKVKTYASQTDIAATLLHQMNLPTTEYSFSNDIFSAKHPHKAFYSYKNGFGYLSESWKMVFNCDSKKISYKLGEITETDVKTGKAYLQGIYNDIEKR